MIRCPNCNQSFHAYMRGGAYIEVSLDGSYLLVDTDEKMKHPDFLESGALRKDSTLICPQCGEIASAAEWKKAWQRFTEKDRSKRKYPEIKVGYDELKGYLNKDLKKPGEQSQAFGWSDY